MKKKRMAVAMVAVAALVALVVLLPMPPTTPAALTPTPRTCLTAKAVMRTLGRVSQGFRTYSAVYPLEYSLIRGELSPILLAVLNGDDEVELRLEAALTEVYCDEQVARFAPHPYCSSVGETKKDLQSLDAAAALVPLFGGASPQAGALLDTLAEVSEEVRLLREAAARDPAFEKALERAFCGE